MKTEKSKNKYWFPVDFKYVKGVYTHESSAHVGSFKHSIDFVVPEGTPIKAPDDGVVLAVKDSSNQGGSSKKYNFKTNFILLKHKNKEGTIFEHLRYNGSKVKTGDKVKRGQIIGYSGNTGWSLGPHLHFMVCKFVHKGKRNDNVYGTYWVSSLVPTFKWPLY
jgi:murein DD-endopeptidase MepM/ murein hydrolase activator NlpD